MAAIQKYGHNWPADTTPLEIEMTCIKKGIGSPSLHYEGMRHILWPHLDDHRWNRLCRDEILKNKVTVLMGCGSSGKTHSAAWIYLCEWMVFPNETCVLVSSTDIRGLRGRVWGEITTLWQQAKDRFPFLPGNLVDSRLMLLTDDLGDPDDAEKRARDVRRGIIAIPCVQNGRFIGLGKYCFPPGTLVDSEFGPFPIECIRPGDRVWSAAGLRRVISTPSNVSSDLVSIHFTDGSRIDCTPKHPFFCSSGWINAIDILPKTVLWSTHEAMRCLRETEPRSRPKEVLLEEMSGQHLDRPLFVLQEDVHSDGKESRVLQSVMRQQVEVGTARDCQTVSERGHGETGQGHFCEHPGQPQGSGKAEEVDEQAFCGDSGETEIIATASLERLRHRTQSHADGVDHQGHFPGSPVELSSCDGQVLEASRHPAVLDRCGVVGHQTCCGNRRIVPQPAGTKAARLPQRLVFEGKTVDRVEVLDPRSDPRYNASEGGYRVHNLEVEGHPSFSVGGLLVHNSGWKQKRMRLVADEAQFMGSSFLSAFANLDKNIDFRAVILGNPNDALDPLGKAAEPIDGWADHLQPEKTDVWKTRFMGGTCVNLIGTDSPNFDGPADKPARYPYLISREKIANTLSFFPKDSVEYFSQCIGAMKIGLMERRVISRDMCRKFKALEDVVWEGSPTTKIAALDASYGGDRCVCGHVEFGKEVGGGIVLNIHPPVIVPIKADEMPEEQITEFVRQYCEQNSIRPENFFHDSTGRGSLGTSLARGWSNQCNPVEFGGMATKRPVCLDLFILDPQTGRQRLKLCLEHYLYFVTELWFSVRYAVEAQQVRNMPEDVMEEMCMRKWDKVGDKIRIEPKTGTPDKPGMKQRTGRSPDLGDWLAIAVEGARRRGFQISKLANKDTEVKSLEWLRDMRDRQEKFRRKSELVEV